MADAGRVIAGTARGIRLEAPGPGRGRSATGSSRPCSRSSSRTCRAPASSTCSRAAGPPGSRRCRVAPRAAVFVERDPAAVSVIAANLGRPDSATRAGPPSSGPMPSPGWRRDGGAERAVRHRDRRPAVRRGRPAGAVLAALSARTAPLAAGARVVAKHFWRDRPPAGVGLLASERERRFGETALTFYRRQEDR